MRLSPADRTVVATLCPDALIGVPDADLNETLDHWFARDHYDDNPVYTWTDNESADQ